MADRMAAIDIGTNTILLLIAEVSAKNQIEPIYQAQRVARLGQGVNETGKLRPENVKKALDVLEAYQTVCRAYSVQKVLCVGTSALRDASDRGDFLSAVKHYLGLEIRVISGEEEARLSFLGALSNKPALKGSVLVADIGGGSTEFVSGKAGKYEGCRSLNVGSVRLTERFFHHDPPVTEELNAFRNLLDQEFRKIDAISVEPDHLVGVAGTVTTLAAMALKMTDYDPGKTDGYELSLEQIRRLIRQLKALPSKERLKIPGLYPGREDVILAGSLILEGILEIFNRNAVIVSDRGLRFGVLLNEVSHENRDRKGVKSAVSSKF